MSLAGLKSWSMRSRAALPLALFVAGAAAGLVHMFAYERSDWYFNRGPTPPNAFAPSMMMAIGRGFTAPADLEHPAIGPFLKQAVIRLDADSVPDLEPGLLNTWDQRHAYLLKLVGAIWWVTGPDWRAVKVLLGLSYGLCAVLCFAFYRALMRPAVAAAACVPALFMSSLLGEIWSVRDYLKTPFLLAAFALLAWLAARRHGTRACLGIAAALGAVIGVGLGFRQDVFVCMPAALAALLALPRIAPGRRAWAERAAAAAVLLLCYAVAAAPVRSAYRQAGAPMHDILMGLAPSASLAAGLEPASYEVIYTNHDHLIYITELGYMRRTEPETPPPFYDDAEAERAGRNLLIETILIAPADFIARAYAALLWALEGAHLPHDYAYGNGMLFAPETGRPIAAAAGLLALAAMAARSPRRAWIAFGLVLYFTASLTAQFEARHIVHMAVLMPLVWGFLLECLLALWAGRGRLRGAWRKPALRGAAHAALAAGLLAAGLWGARLYQHLRVNAWLDTYARAPTEPIRTEPCTTAEGVLFRTAGYAPPLDAVRHAHNPCEDYVMAELAGSDRERTLWIGYDGSETSWFLNLGTALTVPATRTGDGGAVRVYFPVYPDCVREDQMPMSAFAGVTLRTADAADFRGLYRVDPGGLRLMPVLLLPEDRDLRRTYRRIGFPRNRTDFEPPPCKLGQCPPPATPPPAEPPAEPPAAPAMPPPELPPAAVPATGALSAAVAAPAMPAPGVPPAATPATFTLPASPPHDAPPR